MTTSDIVAKLWNLCNILKDDGVTYHQYVTPSDIGESRSTLRFSVPPILLAVLPYPIRGDLICRADLE